jgi:hypothetical protein
MPHWPERGRGGLPWLARQGAEGTWSRLWSFELVPAMMTSSPLGKVLHLHAQDDDSPPMRTLTSRSCFLPQPINVVVVIRQTRTTTSHCASTSTHHHRIGLQIQPWRSRTYLLHSPSHLPSSSIISLFRGPQHSSNSITSTVGVDKASNRTKTENRRRKERKGRKGQVRCIIITSSCLSFGYKYITTRRNGTSP